MGILGIEGYAGNLFLPQSLQDLRAAIDCAQHYCCSAKPQSVHVAWKSAVLHKQERPSSPYRLSLRGVSAPTSDCCSSSEVPAQRWSDVRRAGWTGCLRRRSGMLAMSLHRDTEEALACAVAAIYNAKYQRKSAVDIIPICSSGSHVVKIDAAVLLKPRLCSFVIPSSARR